MKRNNRGRPSKYDPAYSQQILDFFSVPRTKITLEKVYLKNGVVKEKEVEIANELPTVTGFCMTLKIGNETLHRWVKAHREFREAYKKAREMQEEFWKQNSLRGLYNPAFTIFTGKNMFGWRDKTETDLTSGGKPITVTVVSYDKEPAK